MARKGFNPEQPRDAHGRWVHGVGAVKKLVEKLHSEGKITASQKRAAIWAAERHTEQKIGTPHAPEETTKNIEHMAKTLRKHSVEARHRGDINTSKHLSKTARAVEHVHAAHTGTERHVMKEGAPAPANKGSLKLTGVTKEKATPKPKSEPTVAKKAEPTVAKKAEPTVAKKEPTFDEIQKEMDRVGWYKQGGRRERLRDQVDYGYGTKEKPKVINLAGHRFELYQDKSMSEGNEAWSYQIKTPDGNVESVEQAHDAQYMIADWIGEQEAKTRLQAGAASAPEPKPKVVKRASATPTVSPKFNDSLKEAYAAGADKEKGLDVAKVEAYVDQKLKAAANPADKRRWGAVKQYLAWEAYDRHWDMGQLISKSQPTPPYTFPKESKVLILGDAKRLASVQTGQNNKATVAALEKFANGELSTPSDRDKVVKWLQSRYDAINYGGGRTYTNAPLNSKRYSDLLELLGVDAHASGKNRNEVPVHEEVQTPKVVRRARRPVTTRTVKPTPVKVTKAPANPKIDANTDLKKAFAHAREQAQHATTASERGRWNAIMQKIMIEQHRRNEAQSKPKVVKRAKKGKPTNTISEPIRSRTQPKVVRRASSDLWNTPALKKLTIAGRIKHAQKMAASSTSVRERSRWEIEVQSLRRKQQRRAANRRTRRSENKARAAYASARADRRLYG